NNGNTPVDVFDCSQCATGLLCDGFECVDPTDSAKVCSESIPTGACPLEEVCVAGQCTPIKAGKNDCAPERPDGLCPAPSYCVDGFCLPISEQPCSGVAPNGACPAGQTCTGGSCSVATCSASALFGACTGGLVCLNGTCRPETALLTCEELDCAAANREACTEDADGIASCGVCLAGFSDDGLGTCVPDSCISLGCATQFRACDTSVVPAVCGDCVDGYKEGDFGCIPVVCSDLDCAAENRVCADGAEVTDPARCDACVAGFVEDTGVCRLAECTDIQGQCTALNRSCVERNGSTGAQCGDCIAPSVEGADGNCTTCSAPGGVCFTCQNTTECNTGGGPGGFCDTDAELCAQECTTDQQCVSSGFGANAQCSPNGRCARVSASGEVCGAGVLEGEIVEPVVVVLVDQSGSMNANFTTTSATRARWYAVEEILFGESNGSGQTSDDSRGIAPDPMDDGLITRFQNEIQFSVALYTNSGSNLAVRYPAVGGGTTLNSNDAIPPQRNNPSVANGDDDVDEGATADSHRTTLAKFYAGEVWRGDTPSGDAILELDSYLRNLREQRVLAGQAANPLYIVLATDGEPDYVGCLNPNPTTIAEYKVLEAASFARRTQVINGTEFPGITTFSLAVGSNISRNHFQDVANAGAGIQTMLTNREPALTEIGLFPPNPDALSGPSGSEVAASNNPYFNGYTSPSALNGSDCDDGFDNNPNLPPSTGCNP
ncbi:MAG: hypothetical protein AAFY60_07755, partial [Myxococcota bacterium]